MSAIGSYQLASGTVMSDGTALSSFMFLPPEPILIEAHLLAPHKARSLWRTTWGGSVVTAFRENLETLSII